MTTDDLDTILSFVADFPSSDRSRGMEQGRCDRRSAWHDDRDYIISQLADVLSDHAAINDWRRVAAAVDAISGAALY
jgi:hypothetical protein